MSRFAVTAMLTALTAGAVMAPAQTPGQPAQPPAQGGAAQAPAGRGRGPGAPTRDPNSPGYVKAKELPDGQLPAATENGNFIIGPTHNPATELSPKDSLDGKTFVFTMESKDSKIYPGIARQQNPNGRGNPADPAAPRPAITIGPAPYSRKVAVYVPKGYVAGTEIPFLVAGDYREDPWLFVATDNLIAEKKIPPMVVVWIANGGSDGQGSQRGLEYDTMSGKYAEFVETEVLPLVEKQYNVKLTKNPEGRAALGCSSGAAAAMSMAWYRTDLYHRVVSFSGTFVYQQWPPNPETPHGAWNYHETIIPNSPKKPLRIWMAVSDRDNYQNRDDYHDWVVANEHMAQVLADKGYPYQFLFTRNAGHCDPGVRSQTLPLALEYIWQGYRK
jgi:enterochelin esterase-like enzyme